MLVTIGTVRNMIGTSRESMPGDRHLTFETTGATRAGDLASFADLEIPAEP